MVEWHHFFNGHKFKQAPGDNERQGSLVCCNPWGRKELDTIQQLKSTTTTTTTSVFAASHICANSWLISIGCLRMGQFSCLFACLVFLDQMPDTVFYHVRSSIFLYSYKSSFILKILFSYFQEDWFFQVLLSKFFRQDWNHGNFMGNNPHS